MAIGVPPLAFIDAVSGQSTAGLTVAQVQESIKSAPRPIVLTLDTVIFQALTPERQTELVATSLGLQTDRVRIELLSGPQDPSCRFRTRESDVVEIEYSASLEADGREFDSSEQRSGRPFAFALGNGDVVRGLELGTLEMCIGEERLVHVPPQLAFGSRGSKLLRVPPDAPVVYRIKLKSINMQADPRVRREDVDDEQRYSEGPGGRVVNAATLGS
eukprot:CAMPEP_0181225000 /NCGR_PEP_ID=MMETSP1096-20121128/31445_1 /TAXON_ID=156174 ORGANISM="Chrysochromulina ericina, Strain CCMP281" /NCGR_SAMPLE_ID=MMETSP1096 /ASSEMBLY_ACC=CAM_ASM_000453 /LENGTH=215 /DNA_ID=CAMNT_0023318157 /DNA_START=170 /DNA_END=817 /DNA_ORIENTATION=+